MDTISACVAAGLKWVVVLFFFFFLVFFVQGDA